MSNNGGIIGVSDHGGWAVLVTMARDGTLLERRRVELVDEGLAKLPRHSEGQGLPLDEAVELVERVRVSAERHAVLALDAVAMAIPHILGVALRRCQRLPSTIAERIKNFRVANHYPTLAEFNDELRTLGRAFLELLPICRQFTRNPAFHEPGSSELHPSCLY